MSFKLKISIAQSAEEKSVARFCCWFLTRLLANKKQHPAQYLISSNYKADPEGTLLKVPQTDTLSSGVVFSICPWSHLKTHGIYLISSGTGNRKDLFLVLSGSYFYKTRLIWSPQTLYTSSASCNNSQVSSRHCARRGRSMGWREKRGFPWLPGPFELLWALVHSPVKMRILPLTLWGSVGA